MYPNLASTTDLLFHPDHLEELRRLRTSDGLMAAPGLIDFAGMRIYFDARVPKHPRRWQFPAHPFIAYEATDEAWCRFFGFGADVEDRTKMAFFKVQRGYRLMDMGS